MHFLIENFGARAAFGFGPVHGRVGVAQDVLRVRIARTEGRDADRGGRVDGPAFDGQRFGDAILQCGHAAREVRAVPEIAEEHRELIAAEARDGIGRSGKSLQSLGDGAQELIAGRMTERIVHQFEVVEIDEDDGGTFEHATLEHVVEVGREQRPVCQTREIVVRRIVE